jgi:hypothetical protein
MTFTSRVIRRGNDTGHNRVNYGDFTNDTTGGIIDTELRSVKYFSLQYTGNAAVSESPSIVGTLPIDRYVTIVTTSGKSGLWFAVGT